MFEGKTSNENNPVSLLTETDGKGYFWYRIYYIDTVGKDAKKIQEYIGNRLKDNFEIRSNDVKGVNQAARKAKQIATVHSGASRK